MSATPSKSFGPNYAVKCLKCGFSFATEIEGVIPDHDCVWVQGLMSPTSVEKTLEERGKRYGKFSEHAYITQRLKNIAMSHADKMGTNISPSQAEALDMIFHKIGRILNGDPNYADSWHDVAGYAKLVEDELNAKG
jgi:hypothetical protein